MSPTSRSRKLSTPAPESARPPVASAISRTPSWSELAATAWKPETLLLKVAASPPEISASIRALRGPAPLMV